MSRYAALATVAVTLALASGTTTLAHAAAPACKTVVTDDAGVLSPAQLTALTNHAAGLAAKTELRIRTERSLFTGSLNGDEGSLQQDCGWATSSGVRQPRLLVIMVATESRQMGIYPGTALVGTITHPVWLGIEQKNMRPHFAKADWLGGLEAGVDALSKTLASTVSPPSPTSPPTSAPASSPAAAPSATSAAGASSTAQSPIQYDSNGNLIQGDGSAEHPFITDPNGVLPGSPNGNGGFGVGSAVGITGGLVFIGVVVTLIGVARGESSRRRGHYGPDGAWLNRYGDNSPNHNPGMFGGGGFGGGGDSGGGGGSSSDGGGGSSGF